MSLATPCPASWSPGPSGSEALKEENNWPQSTSGLSKCPVALQGFLSSCVLAVRAPRVLHTPSPHRFPYVGGTI